MAWDVNDPRGSRDRLDAALVKCLALLRDNMPPDATGALIELATIVDDVVADDAYSDSYTGAMKLHLLPTYDTNPHVTWTQSETNARLIHWCATLTETLRVVNIDDDDDNHPGGCVVYDPDPLLGRYKKMVPDD